MPYSSGGVRAPLATVAAVIGWIAVRCTVATLCKTTGPPRWIRPRMGGLSFSSVPRPGAPASLRRRPSGPFWPRPRAGRAGPERPCPPTQQHGYGFDDLIRRKVVDHVTETGKNGQLAL